MLSPMIRPRQSCLLLWIALVVCGQTAFAQDGSFTRDGVQLFYRTSGSGAPIIFLSGGPGFTVRYWTEAPKRGVDPDKAGLEQVRAITPGYFFERAKGLAFASQRHQDPVGDKTAEDIHAAILAEFFQSK